MEHRWNPRLFQQLEQEARSFLVHSGEEMNQREQAITVS